MTRMSTVREKTYAKYHGTGLSDKKRIFLPFGFLSMWNKANIIFLLPAI
jgi:hypothetical protein